MRGSPESIRRTLPALIAAALAVLAPLSIPAGTVPITAATLVLYLAACLLTPVQMGAAILLYLALGAVGVPVFSGYGAGVSVLFGPTGGFLLGYLPCGMLASCFAGTRYRPLFALGLLLGTVSLYLCGTLWLSLVGGISFLGTLAMLPLHLPGDLLKIVAAILLFPRLTAISRGRR